MNLETILSAYVKSVKATEPFIDHAELVTNMVDRTRKYRFWLLRHDEQQRAEIARLVARIAELEKNTVMREDPTDSYYRYLEIKERED